MNLYSIESIHLKTSKGKKEKKLTNVPAQLQQPKKIKSWWEVEKMHCYWVVWVYWVEEAKKLRRRGRQKEYKR